MEYRIRQAIATDASALAELAAVTFPLACPADSPASEIAAFIERNLGLERFADYLSDARRTLFVAEEDASNSTGRLLAYTMLVDAPPSDVDVAAAVGDSDAVELSKCYAHPDTHGTGLSAMIMTSSLAVCAADRPVWLGVNSENMRAQKFYLKHGFSITGSRSFQLGNRVEHDHVMVRPRSTTIMGQ